MSLANKYWRVGAFGEGLKACYRRSSGRGVPERVAILDIGSNSVKMPIFDCRTSPAGSVDPNPVDEIVGLSEGMEPNDPKPKLNKKAVKLLLEEVIPACHEHLQRYRPDAIIIMCSEAMRSAHNYNPHKIEELLNQIMDLLYLPHNAWNILSEHMEAKLAADGVLYGDELSNGFVVTMGGGSTEIAKFKSSQISQKWLATFRFGTRTLSKRRDLKSIVNKSFNTTPWFLADPDERTQVLDLRGGAFRVMGRILAQRIDHVDFRSNSGFEGHAFANNEQLIDGLKSLRCINYQKLLNEFLRFEYRQRKCLKHNSDINKEEFRAWKKQWMRTKEYKAWRAKWQKRIGRRVEFIRTAAEVALIAIERVDPRVVKYGAHSVREGGLRHAGLG